MNTEQLRDDFEEWCREKYNNPGMERAQDGYAHTATHQLMPMTYASVQMLWEAYQAGRASLQSQDAERLDWIEAKQGCEIIEFADGTWAVNIPVGPFGIGNNMREAIDYARLVEKGGGMNTKTPYQEGAEARRSGATWFACPYTDFYRRRQWFLGWDSARCVEENE